MADEPMSHQPVPIEPPKVSASKWTKWIVLVLFIVVCGTPGLGLYWFRQHYHILTQSASSMEPTIRRGDLILVDMKYFQKHPPAHDGIVLFKRNGILLVKRVAALPGDTIEGRDNVIYLNSRALSEPYVEHTHPSGRADFLRNFGPVTVRAGECFVMGDNRDNSLDSRNPDYGAIPSNTLVGRPIWVLGSATGNRSLERIK